LHSSFSPTNTYSIANVPKRNLLIYNKHMFMSSTTKARCKNVHYIEEEGFKESDKHREPEK